MASHDGPGRPASGANREPLCRKERGNGQGASGGGSRREEEEKLCQGRDKRKRLCRRSQSSGSGEEEEERRGREKGRKEDLPANSMADYPDVRLVPVRREGRAREPQGWEAREGGADWGLQGGRIRPPCHTGAARSSCREFLRRWSA